MRWKERCDAEVGTDDEWAARFKAHLQARSESAAGLIDASETVTSYPDEDVERLAKLRRRAIDACRSPFLKAKALQRFADGWFTSPFGPNPANKSAVDAMLLLTAMEGDDLKGDLLRCRSDLDIAEVRRLKQTDEKNAAASKLQALFKGRKARKEMEGDTTRLRDERLERRREGHERQRLNIALRRFYAAQDLALPTSVEAIVDHYWNTWSLLDERLVERYEHLPSDFALLHFVEEGHHASLGHQRAQSHIGRHRNARVANARSARAARRPKPKLSATKRAATAGRKKSTRSSSKSPSRKSKSPKTKSPKSKKPKVTIDERFSATLAKASDVERGVPYRAHIAKALAQDLPYGNSSSFCMRRLTSKAVGKRAAAAAAAAAAVRKGEKRTPKSDVGPHAELRGKLLELASALPSGMRPNAVRAVRDLYLHSVDFCFRQYPPDHMTQVSGAIRTWVRRVSAFHAALEAVVDPEAAAVQREHLAARKLFGAKPIAHRSTSPTSVRPVKNSKRRGKKKKSRRRKKKGTNSDAAPAADVVVAAEVAKPTPTSTPVNVKVRPRRVTGAFGLGGSAAIVPAPEDNSAAESVVESGASSIKMRLSMASRLKQMGRGKRKAKPSKRQSMSDLAEASEARAAAVELRLKEAEENAFDHASSSLLLVDSDDLPDAMS